MIVPTATSSAAPNKKGYIDRPSPSWPPPIDTLTMAKQVLSGHMDTVIETIEHNVRLV
jgi:hypothetical protein